MKKTFLFFIFIVMLFQVSKAIPVDPNPKTITTIDGRQLTFTSTGDMYFQMSWTLDKYTILRTDNNAWVYATLDSTGQLIPSRYIACDEEERSAEEKSFLSSIQRNLTYTEEQLLPYIKARNAKGKETKKGDLTKVSNKFPTTGTVNLLVILVQFKDLDMTFNQQDFQRFATDPNYTGNGLQGALRAGSIRSYYLENSNNQLDLNIDVRGPYRLNYNRKYYGENKNGSQDWDKISIMVREAIRQAEADSTVNFAKYDNDDDGEVDAIHIIFAGNSEASTLDPDDIWPWRSNLTPTLPEPDGKKVRIYSISSEFQGTRKNVMAGIGVTCHELTHVLGLPDWYDTDYEERGGKNIPMGEFSLMDQGPYLNYENTPPFLNAVEKEMLKWHTHTELEEAKTYNLPVWGSGQDVSYKISTPNPDEYYIIENRQRRDWDVRVPSSGLLIYYVDKKMVDMWYGNTAEQNRINTFKDSMGCYIISASGIRDNDGREFPFPSSNGNNAFSDKTTPKVELRYSQGLLDKPITDITQLTDGAMQFNFRYNAVSLSTLVACDNNVENIPPLNAGEYENSTYLWQILVNNSWEDAPGSDNTSAEYRLKSFQEGMTFRRILTNNMGVSDTSNAFSLRYDPSVGGSISPISSNVPVGGTGNLLLENYKNNVLYWEYKRGENSWDTIEDSNSDNLQHVYTQAGTYTHRAVVQNAKCPPVYSTEAVIRVGSDSDNYLVTPNPSNGLINISVLNDDLYDIDVFSSFGRIVFSQKGVALSSQSLNLSGLDSGVYIIQLKNTANNSIENKKIILTRTN